MRLAGAPAAFDNGECTTALCLAVRECVARLEAGADAVEPDRIWRGLIDGQLQLVDRFTKDGTRYLVFRPVPEEPLEPRATLTRRERQALEAAVSGMDCSGIAETLGLSASTAASHRARAFAKLGLGPHELMLGPLARAHCMPVGAARWAVVALQPLTERLPSGLTRTEREVVTLVADGLSNAEIAAKRGRSIRTIANQVASVFRKLEVATRAQLVLKLTGCEGPESSRRSLGTWGVTGDAAAEDAPWLE